MLRNDDINSDDDFLILFSAKNNINKLGNDSYDSFIFVTFPSKESNNPRTNLNFCKVTLVSKGSLTTTNKELNFKAYNRSKVSFDESCIKLSHKQLIFRTQRVYFSRGMR